MKKDLLFTSLSLISNFSMENHSGPGYERGVSIEKNSEFIIEGQYAFINNFYGVNVDVGNSVYFYTFDLDEQSKIYKKGKEITIDEIKEGDKLKISYDGNVSLVYPPKLSNVTKIDVVDDGEK